MGVSTNGLLFFGVPFEDGFEFPWEGYEDIENWWEDEMSFMPGVKPWDKEGKQVPGVTDAQISQYFKERREWHAQHPTPVDTVNYCYCDNPMWALIVPGTLKTANRGNPLKIEPGSVSVLPEDIAKFKEFCSQYGIELPSEPAWYLASYWG